jgi:hypothetical protein
MKKEKVRHGSGPSPRAAKSSPAAALSLRTGTNKRKIAKKAAQKNPGIVRSRKSLTADEAFMKAWEYTYKHRSKRVD